MVELTLRSRALTEAPSISQEQDFSGDDVDMPEISPGPASPRPRTPPSRFTVDPADLVPHIDSLSDAASSTADDNLPEGEDASSNVKRRASQREKRPPADFAPGEGPPPPKRRAGTSSRRPGSKKPRSRSKPPMSEKARGKQSADVVARSPSASPSGVIRIQPAVRNVGGRPRQMNYKPLEDGQKFSNEKLVWALDRFDSAVSRIGFMKPLAHY